MVQGGGGGDADSSECTEICTHPMYVPALGSAVVTFFEESSLGGPKRSQETH